MGTYRVHFFNRVPFLIDVVPFHETPVPVALPRAAGFLFKLVSGEITFDHWGETKVIKRAYPICAKQVFTNEQPGDTLRTSPRGFYSVKHDKKRQPGIDSPPVFAPL